MEDYESHLYDILEIYGLKEDEIKIYAEYIIDRKYKRGVDIRVIVEDELFLDYEQFQRARRQYKRERT